MLVLQAQKLALDIGDFSFHVVDLQKMLMEKQGGGGERHLETVLSIAYSFKMFAVITPELW